MILLSLNAAFFFLLSFHWRNKPLPPTLPQTLRGWKRSFRKLMSLYIASMSFPVGRFGMVWVICFRGLGVEDVFLSLGSMIVLFLSFHDTSAKLSFRGASTPFRACSHTHILTLLWLDEYYRRLTIKKTAPSCVCSNLWWLNFQFSRWETLFCHGLFHFLLSSTQADRTHEKKPMSWGKLSIKRWMVRAEMFAKTTPRISSRICWYSGVLKLSDRWIGGKILIGNHGFSNEIWVCPVNVPSNKPIHWYRLWALARSCLVMLGPAVLIAEWLAKIVISVVGMTQLNYIC